MALPLSGPISMSQIKSELSSTSNSLRQYSNTAGKNTPDSMSEFYGYSGCNEYTITTTDFVYGADYTYYECGTLNPISDTGFFGSITVCSGLVPSTIGASVNLIGPC